MDNVTSLAKIIIFIGVMVAIFGLAMLLFSRLTGGRGAPLPGDIVVHRRNITIYFPIITSIVISVILTLLLWMISALRR